MAFVVCATQASQPDPFRALQSRFENNARQTCSPSFQWPNHCGFKSLYSNCDHLGHNRCFVRHMPQISEHELQAVGARSQFKCDFGLAASKMHVVFI